jgi:endogenous inhibitor of DNA gyrase (YacG/DUF329 family)
MDGKCQHCHQRFPRRPHLPNQRFCSRKACQNARKNQWRKGKLAFDKDYKDNQRDAQKRWMAKNPDYWRSYRDTHPEYAETNRQKQRERNQQRKPSSLGQSVIAKSDASCSKNGWISGYYIIERVTGDRIAKSDASFVKISCISEPYADLSRSGVDCKEMT